MSDRYFVRFRGETSGPIVEKRLLELISLGMITPIHEISVDELEWTSVREWLTLRDDQLEAVAAPKEKTPSQPRVASRVPRAIRQHHDPSPPQTQSFDFWGATAILFSLIAILTNIGWILLTLEIPSEPEAWYFKTVYCAPIMVSMLALTIGIIGFMVRGRSWIAIVGIVLGTLAFLLSTGAALSAIVSLLEPTG